VGVGVTVDVGRGVFVGRLVEEGMDAGVKVGREAGGESKQLNVKRATAMERPAFQIANGTRLTDIGYSIRLQIRHFYYRASIQKNKPLSRSALT
jgi:hypothetical protein